MPSCMASPSSTSTDLPHSAAGRNSPRQPPPAVILPDLRWPEMIYSYTQISQYLACPRRYRHRYLDGWQEKDTRAAMIFGRVFEQALAAYFRREDAAVTLFREWSIYKDQFLHYSERDSWDSM